MFTRVALFLLVGTSTFATIPPCDKLDLWRQTVPLKKLSQAALTTEASKGDAVAQFFIATLYLGGKGVTKDESAGCPALFSCFPLMNPERGCPIPPRFSEGGIRGCVQFPPLTFCFSATIDREYRYISERCFFAPAITLTTGPAMKVGLLRNVEFFGYNATRSQRCPLCSQQLGSSGEMCSLSTLETR